MRGRVLEASLVSVLLLSRSLGAQEVDDEALARDIEAYVGDVVAADEFSGAVMV